LSDESSCAVEKVVGDEEGDGGKKRESGFASIYTDPRPVPLMAIVPFINGCIPIGETIYTCIRAFSNAMDLMKECQSLVLQSGLQRSRDTVRT
jgi:hypothetical protein